jgi:glycyl-tRNA synthetase (class II)
MSEVKLEDIVSLCKRRGFIFPGSDVYGGLAGTWDYGPLGVALKRNIMDLWWKMFVTDADNMYGVDAAILMNPKVWQASGHVDTFTDPLVECLNCHNRFRADHLIDDADIELAPLLVGVIDKFGKEEAKKGALEYHNSLYEYIEESLWEFWFNECFNSFDDSTDRAFSDKEISVLLKKFDE